MNAPINATTTGLSMQSESIIIDSVHAGETRNLRPSLQKDPATDAASRGCKPWTIAPDDYSELSAFYPENIHALVSWTLYRFMYLGMIATTPPPVTENSSSGILFAFPRSNVVTRLQKK